VDHGPVKNAISGEINLKDGLDYRGYIKRHGECLPALIINYRGTDVMITSGGRIWSPDGKFESRKYWIIRNIIEKLENAGVVSFMDR